MPDPYWYHNQHPQMPPKSEQRKACNQQAGVVDLTAGNAQQRCEGALPVRAIIIHIAYVVQIKDTHTGQPDRNTATDRFPTHELRLQVE